MACLCKCFIAGDVNSAYVDGFRKIEYNVDMYKCISFNEIWTSRHTKISR